MNPIQKIYKALLKEYNPQGWWPIINQRTLICEYHTNAPRNESEIFEICIGSLLTQGTQWYPNVVRAIQQLKLGRAFTKEELMLVQQAEILHHKEFSHKGIKIDAPQLNNTTEGEGKAEILKANIFRSKQKITESNILTQNTSWANVEKALLNLNKLNAIAPKSLLLLDDSLLKDAIRPAGYFNQKAKKILEFTKFYSSLKGRIPSRDELLNLWGIGNETADSMLLYAFKVPVFVVDAYTKRVFARLGLCKTNSSYEEVQELFHKSLPKEQELFNEYHALIVELAKRNCLKNSPQCGVCPVRNFCHL